MIKTFTAEFGQWISTKTYYGNHCCTYRPTKSKRICLQWIIVSIINVHQMHSNKNCNSLKLKNNWQLSSLCFNDYSWIKIINK